MKASDCALRHTSPHRERCRRLRDCRRRHAHKKHGKRGRCNIPLHSLHRARTLERADEQIELEKKRVLNEVKDEVSRMAIDIAAAVIERDVSEDEHRELIDSFIDEVGKK